MKKGVGQLRKREVSKTRQEFADTGPGPSAIRPDDRYLDRGAREIVDESIENSQQTSFVASREIIMDNFFLLKLGKFKMVYFFLSFLYICARNRVSIEESIFFFDEKLL